MSGKSNESSFKPTRRTVSASESFKVLVILSSMKKSKNACAKHSHSHFLFSSSLHFFTVFFFSAYFEWICVFVLACTFRRSKKSVRNKWKEKLHNEHSNYIYIWKRIRIHATNYNNFYFTFFSKSIKLIV